MDSSINPNYPPQAHHKTGSKWSQFTLKKQLLIVFSLCVLISLTVAELLSISFLLLVSNNISTTSTSILTSQLSDNLAGSVVTTAANFFERELDRIVDAGLTVISNSLSDSLRIDYSTGPEPSFFDSLQSIDRPTQQPDDALRYPGRTISLSHSSWTVPEATSSTPPTSITTDQEKIRDATSHVDAFFRPIYDQNPSIVSLYAGFTNGFFRAYPGTAEREVGTPAQPTAYDPRTRPWYIQSLNYTGNATPSSLRTDRVVIGPYLDAVGKGWQLTTGKAIRDVSNPNGADVGVAAVASTLTVIADRLKMFKLTDSSIVAIYNTAGTALYHPDWDLKAAIGVKTGLKPFTYADATKPRISKDLWAEIKSTSDASISTSTSDYKSKTYNDPDTGIAYLVIWKTLTVTDGTSTNPTYLCIGSIPLSLVNAPVESVRSDMSTTVLRTLLISLGVFLVILIIVFLLIRDVANAAVRPLAKLSDETTKISNNIGTKDLFNGVQLPPPAYTSNGGVATNNDTASEMVRRRNARGINAVDETEDLSDRFYSLVRRIREGSSQQPEAIGAANVFFGNKGLLNGADVDPSLAEILPDMPPPGYVWEDGAGAGHGSVVGSPVGTGPTNLAARREPVAPDRDQKRRDFEPID
ncbi:hypothetical protein HDU97_002752 [Phlyctochytrium planicorne]|nr:hypothetical protein HDU97_002752 [Phlyctochytrium planicorne]